MQYHYVLVLDTGTATYDDRGVIDIDPDQVTRQDALEGRIAEIVAEEPDFAGAAVTTWHLAPNQL
ncbi:hypothetical protein [Streptomyces bohaiensis]|uniref:Uncharacterized protein n=1 Tax=Streptomyces bohaiensis TaxID=1431344 RepID=A0ABX1C4Q9_9ACTN|nr:hypothetical protein [Streptomyces bohaiensis]NJQ14206.1 hypothetical protein [Streptomyces bohaiensis]